MKYKDKDEDKLSDLSNCVLLYILSFLNIKQVGQTCILSTRWTNVWKNHVSYLTCLDLDVHNRKALFPNYLNMPELTRLSVYNFYFRAGDDGCVDPFSAFKKLNTLIINNCTVVNAQTLCISSTMLVNLTIFGYYRHDSYNIIYLLRVFLTFLLLVFQIKNYVGAIFLLLNDYTLILITSNSMTRSKRILRFYSGC
jgi:hypothetical protein